MTRNRRLSFVRLEALFPGLLGRTFHPDENHHLDPTASYWSNDTPFTYQVYEPPYGYHYLKRPFQLVPTSAREVVKPYYIGKDGQRLPEDAPAESIVESVYDVPIKTGVLYQPHPAFAKDEQGRYRYHAMKPGDLGDR